MFNRLFGVECDNSLSDTGSGTGFRAAGGGGRVCIHEPAVSVGLAARRRWIVNQAVRFGVILALLAASPIRAGEGRIPVWEPGTIDEPGHYFVTRDIAATDKDAIIIEADGVVLDLAGRTVSVPDGSPFVGIRVELSGAHSAQYGVVIRNGRVGGGKIGIYVPRILPSLRIERVEVAGTTSHGISVIFDDASEGIIGDVPIVSLDASHLHDIGGDGLMLADPRPSPLCAITVSGNVIVGIGGDGIEIDDCPDGTIKDNTIEQFGQVTASAAGIRLVGGATAAQPVVNFNVIAGGGGQASGIVVTSAQPVVDFLFAHNTISSNGGDGIQIQGGQGRILENSVTGNGGDGLHCAGGDRLFIDGNYVSANDGYGLIFDESNDHAFRDNFLRGNAFGALGGEPNTDAGGNIQ
jgi:hypothetical protein